MYSLAERQQLTDADWYFDHKNYAQALTAYEQILLQHASNLEAKTGKALSLVYIGRYAEAVPCLQELLKDFQESAELKLVLAEALYKSGQAVEAESCLVGLIAICPDNVEALARLGQIYFEQKEYPKANDCLKAALSNNPDHVKALTCMGMMMIKFCQFDNALRVLQKAYSLAPDDVLVLNNLGRASKMIGRHQEALHWYRLALAVEPANACVVSNYLFALNYVEGLEAEYIAQEHFGIAPYLHTFDLENERSVTDFSANRRLRIGYVSADFYTHSVAYFLEPILQHHDHSRFDVFCYSLGTTKDATTERLASLANRWHDLAAADPKTLARVVRQDEIDILVDLSGHTGDNRLSAFAASAAPVQVSWIGYPNTTGLPQMDYYLTDSFCDPPGMTEHLFAETLWRLPRVFCCYLPPVQFPAIGPLPSTVNDYVTFGSFNNFAKVTPSMIKLWSRILRAVPYSRLYLKSMPLGEPQVRNALLAIFAAEGIGEERIELETVRSTPLEHLEEYSRVDIALDTYPYNGTTTTCEAFWMGTPVITLAGITHVSRVGATLLQQVGCSELIAEDEESYFLNAVLLANNRGRLVELRESLRGMMAKSALMDYRGITREVETAFIEMYAKKSHEV